MRATPSRERESRIAVVAPGALGTAVARNRARRRVREAFRRALASGGAATSIDMLITVKSRAATVAFGALEADARAALTEFSR